MEQLQSSIEYYHNLNTAQIFLFAGIIIIGSIWLYIVVGLSLNKSSIVMPDPYQKFEAEEELKRHLKKQNISLPLITPGNEEFENSIIISNNK